MITTIDRFRNFFNWWPTVIFIFCEYTSRKVFLYSSISKSGNLHSYWIFGRWWMEGESCGFSFVNCFFVTLGYAVKLLAWTMVWNKKAFSVICQFISLRYYDAVTTLILCRYLITFIWFSAQYLFCVFKGG